ncbi:MAG: threonine synthase [Treponema sp.]|jgi:threonine synthase|nr:threonine synthase [Treponema sp.]
MQFKSTLQSSSPSLAMPLVSFKDAVLQCLPPEGGLYVPSSVLDMRQFFLYMDASTTYPELVETLTPVLLQGDLNPVSAALLAQSAFNFEPELVQLDERFSLLKLYNGPTGLFKDFGTGFLAAAMEEFLKNNEHSMVLSAVRDATGISIARAFAGRQNITCCLLYPSGPIHGLDLSTFVPNGGNILPIQIRGTFDDCQRLTTESIYDTPFAERYHITTANARNPGRLLPQSFYYIYAFLKLKKQLLGNLIFSVPSGNFGNLIAGLYAWKFGLPAGGFIAAMNANNSVGDFIQGKPFKPKLPIATISPGLDVAVPSNYARLSSFYAEAPAVMRNMVFPASIDDKTTVATIGQVWKKYGVLLDPHAAVAFAAAERLIEAHGLSSSEAHIVVLATGHPAIEGGLIREITGQTIKMPEHLIALRKRTDPIAIIDPQLESLESAIASCV